MGAILGLAGCAGANFANRMYCSADRQQAAFTSWYLGFGVGSQLDPKDAGVICAAPAAASGVK
jgi:hypothetical protein